MSRLVVVSLASLVAVAALGLHGPFDTSRARTRSAASSAAAAANAAAVVNAPAVASAPTTANAPAAPDASSAPASPSNATPIANPPAPHATNASKPAAAPGAAFASRDAFDRYRDLAALVAAFAGGIACAAVLPSLASAVRRRTPAQAHAATPIASNTIPFAAAQSSEWQMLDGDDNDLVSLHDPDGIFRYASGPLLELTGFSRHELIGRNGRDFVHEDDLPTLLAAVHASRSESEPSPVLLRVRDRRGRFVWIEAEFRHSVSRTGEPEVLCVARSVARSAVPLSAPVPLPAVHEAKPEVHIARPRHAARLDSAHGPSLQDLCHAFERREFELHYQLKVGVGNWEVTGVEALLRWNAPEGSGRTAEIIASAERTGFIVTLGEWVMRAAARQSLQWRRAGLRYPVAVNVSAMQLNDAGFVPLMRELVARDRELPFWMELEITEHALAGHSERAVQTIAQLVALGFRLHVDDFGTGYSKLAQLSRMPLRALKIDRSIVRELTDVGNSGEVVEAVVSLSRALRVKVIAEGVETAEQLERLRAHGCDEVQGYLFSRPMSADAMRTLVLPSGLAGGNERSADVQQVEIWRPVGDSNPCTDRERVVS